MIIADDISRLKRLDKKYDKLTDSPEDTEKKQRIGEKIAKVRDNIVSELDRRKEKLAKHEANYLARHPGADAENSKKLEDFNKRLEHIDKRIKDIDSIIDPALIKPDAAESSSSTEETGNSGYTPSHDEESVSMLDSNDD